MIKVSKRVIGYLYDYKYINKKYQTVNYEIGDKVCIHTKSKDTVTGEIVGIGTKFLDLKIGSTRYYRPRMDGKWCRTPIKVIVIKDIEKIAKYPISAQRFNDVYVR